MKNVAKLNKKAFTLVEMLVVVLIIGILAAIAVPKYQVAVAKSEYATLKAQTRAIAEAINRYNLATGTYPTSLNDLDITTTGHCNFLIPNNGTEAMCFLEGRKMGFYFYYTTLKPGLCYTLKNYEAGKKVCQQETGNSSASCPSEAEYCLYYY